MFAASIHPLQLLNCIYSHFVNFSVSSNVAIGLFLWHYAANDWNSIVAAVRVSIDQAALLLIFHNILPLCWLFLLSYVQEFQLMSTMEANTDIYTLWLWKTRLRRDDILSSSTLFCGFIRNEIELIIFRATMQQVLLRCCHSIPMDIIDIKAILGEFEVLFDN